jgi:hypothetical protein
MGIIAELCFFTLLKVRGAKGPIFEDGTNFDTVFCVFHDRDGVVPLSEGSLAKIEKPFPKPNPKFNPLAAKAATISLSAFGGFFSFGHFSNKRNKKNFSRKNPNNLPQVIYLGSSTPSNFISVCEMSYIKQRSMPCSRLILLCFPFHFRTKVNLTIMKH